MVSGTCTRCFGDPECRCAELFTAADAREDRGEATWQQRTKERKPS